jgi:ferric-dicitrate binding protein FerR (iron transport regulator)
LEYNTIEAPAGGQWQVKLPDGSLIFLNASSSITYPIRFVGNERRVHIIGEAYFEIAHNKEIPFQVESRGQIVEVLGTKFNVTAYADEKIIRTTLLKGSVKIITNSESKLLKPGQQAQVSGNKFEITSDVDLEEIVAWKNGYFKFNESLESIMAKISRWYDVDVEYRVKPDSDLTFSGKISRSRDISGILKMLEYTGDVHFRLEGRRVIVTK